MQYQVRDASPFRYYTTIPNLVDDTGLSPLSYRLYGHLKRVAGENGECWQSTDTLAEACCMSTASVSRAKKELTDCTPPLISVEPKPNPNGGKDYHAITILNVWEINNERYEQLTHSNLQGSHSNLTSYSQKVKNNPIKNNPIKKEEVAPPLADAPPIKEPVFTHSCTWCGGIGRHEEGCDLPQTKKPPTPQQQMVETLALVTGFDMKLHGPRLGKAASKLLAAGYGAGYIEDHYHNKRSGIAGYGVIGLSWWYANDFRGKKGDMPTPEQVVETIGRVKAQAQPTPEDIEKLRQKLIDAQLKQAAKKLSGEVDPDEIEY